MNIDYIVQSEKYLIDGQSVTKAVAFRLLCAEGFTPIEIASLLRAHRLCATIEAHRPPPSPDLLGGEAAARLLASVIWQALAADLAKREARRWIAANLRPARRPHFRGCYSWKHEFERDARKYIRAGDFAAVLVTTGIKVVGDRVYTKEVKR